MEAKQTHRDAAFAQEFDMKASVYAEMGISRDQFIRSRRIDEGLATLDMTGTPAAAAAPAAPALASNPTNARFGAEYDASAGVYAEMGISRDQFIRSRRIDEGLDSLNVAGAAK